MAIRALLHLYNDDPILCDLDSVPEPRDNFVRVRNPTKRDGKPVEMINHGATSVLYPWSRITFIELFGEESQRDAVMGFFREADST